MNTIYVTGHRNPDLDSIASAIGYAELKQRLHPDQRYTPARIGDPNAQTAWALERSGAPLPQYLPHIMLRVKDVMQTEYPCANHGASIRDVGLALANAGGDMIPIVDDEGMLVGMLTARDLARRYIRESSEPSSFADRPASVDLIVQVLGGELLMRPERRLDGRLWAVTVDVETMGKTMGADDIVVIGDRRDAQLRAVQIGVALLVSTYNTRPDDQVLELARQRGTGVVVSPLDSYVTGRLVSLSVPVREVMSREPLTTDPDDLIADITDRIKEVHYSAAIAVNEKGAPVGLVTRAELVNPEPRSVLLVDHAEQAQSVIGIEQAQIVEILDHHHIGSVETKVPVAATFDPVGSTATLVIERFRRNGREPKPSTAMMLLAAILSDTVILSSPTTTERDRAVVRYLEELLLIDAKAFGTEMFEASSDVGGVPARDIIRRDAKEYQVRPGKRLCIAQIETVGKGLLERRSELLDEMQKALEQGDFILYALMVTDIVDKGTELLVAGDAGPVERAFGVQARKNVLDLPGVMSRKKQVAPRLLAAL
ncbi:MAG: manganese-dependent inorganic pyrophosphatase [Miltoncostaeaceae bacterium]|jgi:manganese-dependent inorganic pyrophosphatase|nr:manganese-dependent inorganic pyrophosphatase [Miltoncostaeaceae bacterium]